MNKKESFSNILGKLKKEIEKQDKREEQPQKAHPAAAQEGDMEFNSLIEKLKQNLREKARKM